MKHITTSAMIFLPLILGLGCFDVRVSSEFDGVYDAFPFNACLSDYDVYLLIDKGNMLIYGPHGELCEAGRVEEGRWRVWQNQDIILKRKPSSLTMQVVGKDSFCELPLLPMTKEEFNNLKVSQKRGISELLRLWEEPPLSSDNNEYWKLLRIIGYGSIRNIRGCFQSEVSLSSNILNVTISSLSDYPMKIAINPTSFNGRVVVIPKDRMPKIFEFDSEEEPSLIVLEPRQSINYSINLDEDAWPPVDYLPTTNDLIFAELNIELPIHKVVSDCIGEW